MSFSGLKAMTVKNQRERDREGERIDTVSMLNCDDDVNDVGFLAL